MSGCVGQAGEWEKVVKKMLHSALVKEENELDQWKYIYIYIYAKVQ